MRRAPLPRTRALPARARPSRIDPVDALLLGCALLAGCRTVRELRVTSEPSQAEVRLDGVRVGMTPCYVPFEHYGTRRLTLYLASYRTYSERIALEAPWYATFPLDVVTEVLVPVGWRDERRVHIELRSGSTVLLEPDLPSVLRRAEDLRHAGPQGPVQAGATPP